MAQLWESFYPLEGLDETTRALLVALEAGIPSFVTLLVNHRPKLLRGASLREVMAVHERTPERLSAYFSAWRRSPRLMRETRPSLAFAVLGQARAEGRLSPEREGRMLSYLLTYWALRSTLDASAGHAQPCRCGCKSQATDGGSSLQ
jgi:hypothetical protein